MRAYDFLILLTLLFLAGMGFAYWVRKFKGVPNSIKEHLFQWAPLLLGALCYFYAGYKVEFDTYFSLFGQLGSLLVISPVGYVFGRSLFSQ